MVRIHSTIESIATKSTFDCAGAHVTAQPALVVDYNLLELGSEGVRVQNLDPDLVAFLAKSPQADALLRSILRVRVVGAGGSATEDLPDVFGHGQLLEGGVRFIPHFPFEAGVRYHASFDARPLGRPEHREVLNLEFSLPSRAKPAPARVKHVFPSSGSLPENLLRFYVCFSGSMQRGRAEEEIRVLGPDGRPAPDVLYRPPVELWDSGMRHLTILLDPGRLKRGVGPNRQLGPPLKVGQEYTLAIGSGMMDWSGRSLGETFYKRFRVTQAVREAIGVARWKILAPVSGSRRPLEIMLPKPLDWALLCRSITIESEGGEPMHGRIAIDRGERRWSFTPASSWAVGLHYVRIASNLEDICGNNLLGAFDRPFRSSGDSALEVANCSIPFRSLPPAP